MKALVIETCGSPPWVALSEEGCVAHWLCLPAGSQLTSDVFPAIQDLIGSCRPSYIAVGVGPGSYAGSRTGVAIAKILAFTWGIPLVPFPSPFSYFPPSVSGPFFYHLDAKMGQRALFKGKIDEFSMEIGPFSLISSSEAPLSSTDETICTPGAPSPEIACIHAFRLFERNQTCSPEELKPVYFR